jgi:hypothetical protein
MGSLRFRNFLALSWGSDARPATAPEQPATAAPTPIPETPPFKDLLYAFERRGRIGHRSGAIVAYQDLPREAVRLGQSTREDLKIDALCTQIMEATPNAAPGENEYKPATYSYCTPIQDLDAILLRQEAIYELFTDEGLAGRAKDAKLAMDTYLRVRRYEGNKRYRDHTDGPLQKLENISNLVGAVEAITAIGEPGSARLQRMVEFGKEIAQDPGFWLVQRFIHEVYRSADLGELLHDTRMALSAQSMRENSIQFDTTTRLLTAATRMIVEDPEYRTLIAEDLDRNGFLSALEQNVHRYKDQLLRFQDTKTFEYKNNDDFNAMLTYWIEIVSEGLAAQLPEINTGDLTEELGFYVGSASVHRKWQKAGVSVAKPVMRARGTRLHSVQRSYELELVREHVKYTREPAPVPNDILTISDESIGVITGPNSGGKTTYLRMIGQMSYTAQCGLLLPAESAELSIVDALYTALDEQDSSRGKAGRYETQLRSIAQFLGVDGGGQYVTPDSLVLFDEVGSGTDDEEAGIRTWTILEHLSQIGTAAYLTTHQHALAARILAGELPGGIALAAAVDLSSGRPKQTFRIERNRTEASYGDEVAAKLHLLPDLLADRRHSDLAMGRYLIGDTRMEP